MLCQRSSARSATIAMRGRTEPTHGRRLFAHEVEACANELPERAPVEALVIVEGRSVRTGERRAVNVLRGSGTHALDELARRVTSRTPIVADAAPASDSSNELLDDDGKTGLDRHTDDEAAAGREKPIEAFEQRRRISHVLEHLHAVDRVVAACLPLEVRDQRELQALAAVEPGAAVLHD
jgi:hypothetical protein